MAEKWVLEEIIGTETAIDKVNGENSKVNSVYDLTGRKVESPKRGIYIIDGQKVFIK